MAVPFPLPVVEGSQVVLRGVVPGTYRFMSSPQGIRTRVGPWWLKSITIDDREVLDQPLEIPPNAKSMRVVFSGQASQLSGVVTDRDGSRGYGRLCRRILRGSEAWFLHSRRVAARSVEGGRSLRCSNLPAGELSRRGHQRSREQRVVRSRASAGAFVASAARVTIGENQSVSHNVTIGAAAASRLTQRFHWPLAS